MDKADAHPAVRLVRAYNEASATGTIGGESVLRRLGLLSSACILNESSAQDAVAFALSAIFNLHAEDRSDRPVTTADTYLLEGMGGEWLETAVNFVALGGGNEVAIGIIKELAHLTPDRLYGRWPPEVS